MITLGKFGTNITGIPELQQSLSLYFRTPKGSIPMHPELGFPIFLYVDMNVTKVLDLIREVNTGLALWDNRITIVSATPIFTVGELKMRVVWYPTGTNPNNPITQTIPIITSNPN